VISETNDDCYIYLRSLVPWLSIKETSRMPVRCYGLLKYFTGEQHGGRQLRLSSKS